MGIGIGGRRPNLGQLGIENKGIMPTISGVNDNPQEKETKETTKTNEAKAEQRVEEKAAQEPTKKEETVPSKETKGTGKRRGRPRKKESEGKKTDETAVSFFLKNDLHEYLSYMAVLTNAGSKRSYIEKLIIEDREKNKELYYKIVEAKKSI